MKKRSKSHYNIDFEKERFPCTKEWWCVEGFFTTLENDKKWSFKADLYQAIGRDKSIWSVHTFTLFDLENNKSYKYLSEDDSKKITSEKNRFNIKYNESYMKGTYPNYKMLFSDPENKITLDIEFDAEALPHWISQNITDGWLPFGLGCFKYGFVPKNKIKGILNINNQAFSIKGKGYFEHIWGDFSFFNFYSSKRSIIKTVSIYAKLLGRWIRNLDIKMLKSITFSTDNRPPGYDWCWCILDNGWSIFYGNIMSYINFKYNKTKYLKKYDFYYPSELEITAKKDRKKIFLHISNISESVEDLTEATEEKNLLGFILCQVPSKVKGYYFKGYYFNRNKKISLTGVSKIEIHRVLKAFGHNSIKFNYVFSKNRFGVLFNLYSNYFGKKIDINLQFLPRPNLKIIFNRTNKS